MTIPRPEYPRPQFTREDWLCLNGEWQFEIDHGDSGKERGLVEKDLAETIVVPFCPESELSGVGHTDFMKAVWYRRTVEIPEDWNDRRIILHFQAVDYDATVWINGTEVVRHRGGFSPFQADITDRIPQGRSADIVVRARDYNDDPKPRGKQCQEYDNVGCLYTRTTGIWQSVWLEPVPETHMQRPRITPDTGRKSFILEVPVSDNTPGHVLQAELLEGTTVIASAQTAADSALMPRIELQIPEDKVILWEVGNPHLYDIRLKLTDADGKQIDAAMTYAGLRSLSINGRNFLINGKPVFQRLVLDQGYYPDGILTAPTDEALKADIELSIQAGFNGARLHQKVFEERFLYWCDQLGYIVWGEFADWGCRTGGRYEWKAQAHTQTYITQWLEIVARDYSHPSIIGWCPLNETAQKLVDDIVGLDDVTRGMFLATKAFDTTRPVLDTSGYSHRVPETEVYDSHNYTQDPREFAAALAGLADNKPFTNPGPDNKDTWSLPYTGQPYFVSEFGGIKWNPDEGDSTGSWGYGDTPKTLEAFYERFEKLCAVLLDDPLMFAYCYTQLTDVFQEQNGIYKFDRSAKFDMDRISAAQTRAAAYEKEETAVH